METGELDARTVEDILNHAYARGDVEAKGVAVRVQAHILDHVIGTACGLYDGLIDEVVNPCGGEVAVPQLVRQPRRGGPRRGLERQRCRRGHIVSDPGNSAVQPTRGEHNPLAYVVVVAPNNSCEASIYYG